MSPATGLGDAGKDATMRTVLVCAWPALLLATFCLLPFLNKAFLIDDPFFLSVARQILRSPLHPMDFSICWNTAPYCGKAYALTPGDSLMAYALVPTILGGAREWMAHLTQLIFVWVAVITMSSFVLRMGWGRGHAFIGALLLVATPPLLPMATTVMPDVLALTVGLVGMERVAAWKQERKWHQGAVSAVALGLAGMARPHLTLFVPLAAFFLLDSVKIGEILPQIRESWRLWVPVLAGGVVLVTSILVTRERGLTLNPPATFSGLDHIRTNFRSYLLYFCFPLPLSACWALAQWDPRRTALMLLAATTLAWLAGGKQLALALIGSYVLSDLLWNAWKNGDREGLFLILWLLVPLPIAYYGHLPIKYLLPCIPALILICFRLLSTLPVKITYTAAILTIIGGIGYSLLILRADSEFASFGRDALTGLVRPHVLAGERVWFPNQAWSYWYAPLAGAELVVPGVREPKQGDLFVVGIGGEGDTTDTLKKFANRRLVQLVTHKYRFGRTMGEGAGLYTNGLGNWLWKPGGSEDDRFELWKLNN
jgi:hypothetical protein